MEGVRIEREDGMRPMVVTAHLRGPLVTIDGRLSLDGILEFRAFEELPDAEREALPLPAEVPDPPSMAIPLAKWRWGDHWGWCASFGRAQWYAQDTRQVRQRTPVDEMIEYGNGEGGRIETGSGRFKSYDLPFPTRLTDRVQWCAVGHIAEVWRMVSTVPSIGKKRNIGPGGVSHWTVRPSDADWSLLCEGAAMRTLPVGFPGADPTKATTTIGAYRAPYWHRGRQCPVYVPMEDAC